MLFMDLDLRDLLGRIGDGVVDALNTCGAAAGALLVAAVILIMAIWDWIENR